MSTEVVAVAAFAGMSPAELICACPELVADDA
jgi:hypothetical protein